MVAFSFSSAYTSSYPGVAFGLTLISGCKYFTNPPGFDQYKRKLLRKMRKRETLAEIKGRIHIYDRFFQDFGFPCPLPKHLRRAVNSGFPRYNLMVDAHFMAEMSAGILVAVTDFDRFEGGLTLDLARAGEVFLQMGGQKKRAKPREIVLRDANEIVCILCQGADEKTRVTPETTNVLFYAYAVPGIDSGCIEQGLRVAADCMTRFGQGRLSSLDVFTP
jgi:DNA/RNA-binding domain of Phe-tRNA-synthetase-like protein